MYDAIKKTEIASEEEVENNLEEMRKDIVCFTRGAKHGSIDVKFRNKEIAVRNTKKLEERMIECSFKPDFAKELSE